MPHTYQIRMLKQLYDGVTSEELSPGTPLSDNSIVASLRSFLPSSASSLLLLECWLEIVHSSILLQGIVLD